MKVQQAVFKLLNIRPNYLYLKCLKTELSAGRTELIGFHCILYYLTIDKELTVCVYC